MAFVVYHSPNSKAAHLLSLDLDPLIHVDKALIRVLYQNHPEFDLRLKLNNNRTL